MGYYDKEKQPRGGMITSVNVDDFIITVDSEMGKTETVTLKRGVVRMYNDMGRIEFKEYGGPTDGRVHGWTFETVREYHFSPSRKFDEF